jgi:hypothetical protein
MSKGFILRWADKCGKSTVVGIHHANALNVIANSHTPAAQNAFGTVTNDRRTRTVDHILGSDPFEPEFADLDLFTEVLQLAVLISVAAQTIFGMVRQNQFIQDFPDLPDFGRIGFDNHSFFDFRNTGSHQVSRTFHLYNADSAGAYLMDIFKIAKMRNKYVVVFGGLENGRSFFSLNSFIVDGKRNKSHNVNFIGLVF